MLLRRRMDAHDFAARLIQLHANNFGRASLLAFAEGVQHPIKESQLQNALSEWLFFGAYVIRQCVGARCGADTALRDAILDEFFERMYAGLRAAGVAESDLPHVEHCITARFQHYDRSQAGSRGSPMYSLGLAASTLMFGEGVEAVCFAVLPEVQFADSMDSIRKLFDDFKVAH